MDAALERGIQWLGENELAEINQARSEVAQALDGNEANILKRAVQRLDQATESLAAKIVEQAIDQASGWNP